ncbi:hypothetical protein KO507_10695 [Gilvimarinus agarilyticus]|nr:hypothetical protein [Gilvimarinus agarilyticus]
MARALLLTLSLAGLSLIAHAQEDALETTITGNQEQPQVLYIVPWQTPDSPTLKYDVVQSQSARVYEHLERSELKRELAWQKPLEAPENSDGSQPNADE